MRIKIIRQKAINQKILCISVTLQWARGVVWNDETIFNTGEMIAYKW